MPAELVADRFEIGEAIGAGGMGTVYRATDITSGDIVALKIVREGVPDAVARFAREISTLAKIGHPKVVRYVASGLSAQGPFLVMEWLDGEDLGKRLKRAGLSIAEIVQLALGLAQGLEAVHAAGIIHRDVKPGNIFFPDRATPIEESEIKLVDFGLARFETTDDAVSQSGLLVGTPGYMAPEQARARDDLDGRVDVFSLGCVLYKCLTGQGPFSAPDAMATLAKILFDDPKPISELRADVPSEFERLIMSMLAKDRKDRPSAAEIARALELETLDVHDGGESRVSVPSLVGLTDREQRVVSVVVAAHADLGDEEATIEQLPRLEFARIDVALRELAKRLGAHIEVLAGGVVATLFGVGAATDQAARAARLALGMRALLGDVPIAVATGRAEVGARVVGDVIDRAVADAAALHDHPGIWLDQLTAGLLGPELDVVIEGGRPKLVGQSERPAVQVRTLLGKATPCVGRDRELAALEGLYDESASEPVARVAVFIANAGVGKSRVRYEWLLRLAAKNPPPRVWLCRGDPMTASAPFALVRQWIRDAAGLRPDDEPEQARAKLLARIATTHVADPLRVAEFLGEMIELRFDDTDRLQLRSARQDAVLMGDQMRRAFEEWLAGETAKGPLVLVLEDLQWGDVPSVKLVDSALKTLANAPLLVAAFARPEVETLFPSLWADRGGIQKIVLSELTPKASAKLVRGVLTDASDEVVERIVAQAAGNAFFLEEILRAHAEGRAQDAPETVRAVVQRRLEGLPPDARRVLRAASVFGQVFWAGGLLALLGGASNPMTQVGSSIDAMVNAEVMSRRASSRFANEDELIFHHALVRDAAYDMLTTEDRELGHRLAGDWLERTGEPSGVVLAEHFDRGNAPDRAIAHYLRAATQALEGSDLPAVVTLGERAVRCGAKGTVLGEVRYVQAEACRWLARLQEARQYAEEAMNQIEPGTPHWYSAICELATASVGLGKPELLESLRDAIVDPARANDFSDARVIALSRLCGQAFATGKRALALELVSLAEASSTGVVGVAAARLATARAYRSLYSSDPGPYYDLIVRARELYEGVGDLRNSAVQAVNQGYIAISLGVFDVAEAALSDVQRIGAALGLARVGALALQNLGFIRFEQGRMEESIATQRQALALLLVHNDMRLATFSRVYLSWALASIGQVAEAFEHARLATELSEPMPPAHVAALATLAEMELKHGSIERALELASLSNAKLEELGGVEDSEAHIRVVYAETLHAVGRHEEAKAIIKKDLTRLAERAERIAKPAWRETFRTNVSANARVFRRAKEWGVE